MSETTSPSYMTAQETQQERMALERIVPTFQYQQDLVHKALHKSRNIKKKVDVSSKQKELFLSDNFRFAEQFKKVEDYFNRIHQDDDLSVLNKKYEIFLHTYTGSNEK